MDDNTSYKESTDVEFLRTALFTFKLRYETELAANETLRKHVAEEAEYSQQYAKEYKGTERGLRHQKRAERLLSYLK